jgi:hypothetical protein
MNCRLKPSKESSMKKMELKKDTKLNSKKLIIKSESFMIESIKKKGNSPSK